MIRTWMCGDPTKWDRKRSKTALLRSDESMGQDAPMHMEKS